MSKHFCLVPWTHLHLWPSGKTYMCCLHDSRKPLGVVNDTTTLEDLWNAPRLREIRLNMLDDQPSEECSRCYELEQSGMRSMRIDHNEKFAHHQPMVDETAPDGSLARMNMPYMDIRFSNICNFRCRICGPELSSNWHDDAKKEHAIPADQPRILRPTKDPETLWTQIEQILPTVEKIYFAGGEPLMMEEHFRILRLLAEQGRFDVKLTYTTNLSQRYFKGVDVFELWNRFQDVEVGASIDGGGDQGEYMRKGMRWERIEENRRAMQEVCPNVRFYINYTLSVFNFLTMADFHRTWVEQGYLGVNDFNVNPLTHPDYFRAHIAPVAMRDQAIAKYEEHIAWLKSQGKTEGDFIVDRFRASIRFLEGEQTTGVLNKFKKRIAAVDGLRGESFAEIFPELAFLLE